MRVVGIGGGHGLAVTLAAARTFADEVAAVVTVADDGGSSGRLTRELGIPPPGDIRNCLVALAREKELAELYQHRFKSGALTGHTAGNLLIAALTEMRGDFAAAVAEAGELLRCDGKVYPATTDLVELGAQVDGGRLRGQVAVMHTRERIQAVFLTPRNPVAHPSAVQAIGEADLIVLGPGSLFTSLIATLLVPGIRAAVHGARGRRVFVCNTRMQKGETDGLTAAAHLEALLAHAGSSAVDAALVQSPVVEPDGVAVDIDAPAVSGIELVAADTADSSGAHDPSRLAEVLKSLA